MVRITNVAKTVPSFFGRISGETGCFRGVFRKKRVNISQWVITGKNLPMRRGYHIGLVQ